MDGRKRLSGWQYKKVAEEKKKKLTEVVNKTAKLDTFFTRSNLPVPPEPVLLESVKEFCEVELEVCSILTPSASTASASVPSALTSTPPASASAPSASTSTPLASASAPPVSTSTPSASASTPSASPSTPSASAPSASSCVDTDKIKPAISELTFVVDEIEDQLTVSEPDSSVHLKPNYDPALWIVNEETREYFVKNGWNQNKDCDFKKSERQYPDRKRVLAKWLFDRKLANGEIVNRDFLIYSPSLGSLFCGPCKLFSSTSTQFTENGFSDWKHASARIKEHENSHVHYNSVIVYKQRAEAAGRIDKLLQNQVEEEIRYWKAVLQRVVAVIKKLASRGLAFRGTDEKFGSFSNGNYMMCLELIAEFDPFLKAHIEKYGKAGKGKQSYLSSTICEELIEIMAKTVIDTILNDAKKSKYYSIIVDSTPDVTHIDQLSFILRYVNELGIPEEHFVEFMKNQGHTGEELVNSVLSFLQSKGLDIQNCRGQSYDNASNMSGMYSGLQPLPNCPVFAHKSTAMTDYGSKPAGTFTGGFFHNIRLEYGDNNVISLKQWSKLCHKLAKLEARRLFLLECRRRKQTTTFIQNQIDRLVNTTFRATRGSVRRRVDNFESQVHGIHLKLDTIKLD
ncbi:zinc finger MYM-type protein 1-like [Diabrotica virgifera virgifera]|uniref:DUF4371 domain-containing protein n=1 Tax=Diabrotica virgifera virgifera TaxID=50390 RepID=A0ABM5KCY6_DIAVI|nr:zinc finger MYM-type protein 1-like [Diabrotica virgifera virgifera]